MRLPPKPIRFLLLLLVAAGCLFLLLRPTEPKYNGKPLSFWITQYESYPLWPHNNDARDAIRAMGTNAVPLLIKWGSYKPPDWTIDLYQRPVIPVSVVSWAFRILGFNSRTERSDAAILAFGAFPTNADTTIQELTELMKDHRTAISVVSRMGPVGIPPLLHAWSNSTNQDERLAIEYAVVENVPPNTYNTNLAPLLVSATHQPTKWIQEAASNSLFQIAPQMATNTPAK